MFDLIIIGGGPAGISAGIYAARAKLNSLLITKDFGGQLLRKAGIIENYLGFEEISGVELMEKFKNHLKKQEIKIVEGETTKIEKGNETFFVHIKGNEVFQSLAVIVASGADPRPLEVPGEKEFIGRGVSYCVACDGALFKGKTVAVVGGGNAGFEAALFLVNYAKIIYILESGEEVRADKENQERVKKTGKVQIMTSTALKRIEGKNFVEAIIFEDQREKKEKKIVVDGIFVEIGSQPATSFVKGLVDFNERDEIKVDFETFQTKTPGLFAAGDVNLGKYKQIVTAAGEGAKAALAAYDYLKIIKK